MKRNVLLLVIQLMFASFVGFILPACSEDESVVFYEDEIVEDTDEYTKYIDYYWKHYISKDIEKIENERASFVTDYLGNTMLGLWSDGFYYIVKDENLVKKYFDKEELIVNGVCKYAYTIEFHKFKTEDLSGCDRCFYFYLDISDIKIAE